MDSRAKPLIDRQQALASDRGTLEEHWREIAELINPMRDDFNIQRRAGEKRTQKIFDGTPGMAAENLAAGLWGMLTNSANKWFELRTQDEDLNDSGAVKEWLETVNDRLLAAFAANGQRFYTRVTDLYADLVGFGTAVFYTDEEVGRGLHFSCRHLAECYIAENARERVDTLFRLHKMTARQVAQKFGADVLGPKLKEIVDKRPDETVDLLHAVLPVEDYGGEVPRPPKNAPWEFQFASVYISMQDHNVLEERGYVEFPFQVPRWSQRSRGVYGDSPAMLALADSKMLNQMSRTTIVAAQKNVDPPLLAPDEASVRGIRTTPGGIIYGGMDPQGRRLYDPLQTGARIDIGLEMEEQRRNAVREAFHASLLMMIDQPGRTATEVLILQEEKMRNFGPYLGRLQSEFLDPLIGRCFGLLMRAGELPPPPPELQDAEIEVEYVSPMARAQRSSEAAAVARTLEIVAPMASVDAGVFDNFDLDEMSRLVGIAYGLPSTMLRDPREIEKIRQRRAQMQALAAAAEAAPGVAQAAKQGAEAQQIAQGQR